MPVAGRSGYGGGLVYAAVGTAFLAARLLFGQHGKAFVAPRLEERSPAFTSTKLHPPLRRSDVVPTAAGGAARAEMGLLGVTAAGAALAGLLGLGGAAVSKQARTSKMTRRVILHKHNPNIPKDIWHSGKDKGGYGRSNVPQTFQGLMYNAGWGSYYNGQVIRTPGNHVWKRDKKPGGQPQIIPVKNLEGEQIGEETMHLRCFSRESANYVVHQGLMTWFYWNKKWRAWCPWKKDTPWGKKPWPTRGTGRARAKNRWGVLWGRSCSNQKPHGWDKCKTKNFPRLRFMKCISTALQSKWKKIHIVDGLETAFPEPKHHKLRKLIYDQTLMVPGKKPLLIITRKSTWRTVDLENNLYYSSRLIPQVWCCRPKDIDPGTDGLYQVIKAREIIMSREAYFDLMAKFNAKNGWAFWSQEQIMLHEFRKLAKEFPSEKLDRYAEHGALPRTGEELEEWAKKKRQETSVSKMMEEVAVSAGEDE